ncbi:MAG TPA: prepilin-type N-terminal cleavage/methylation domain-containing protein [Dehalococcoidia bacterium]|nr:prepilin-type N-terminal cleavage/methylation domain-containing protein [Dehalococcoidia bacterium]
MRDKVQDLRTQRGEAGFTLVELLIVLAILAILVAVVLPNFTGLLGKSQTTAADAERVIIQTAVDAKMASDGMATTPAVTTATTDMTTAAGGFGLYPTYMRGTATQGTYTVDTTGEVSQATTGY